MELTKEYFDIQLEKLNNRLESATVDFSDETSDCSLGEMVQRIDERDIEDSDAFAKDIVQLKKEVKHLKLKHA